MNRRRVHLWVRRSYHYLRSYVVERSRSVERSFSNLVYPRRNITNLYVVFLPTEFMYVTAPALLCVISASTSSRYMILGWVRQSGSSRNRIAQIRGAATIFGALERRCEMWCFCGYIVTVYVVSCTATPLHRLAINEDQIPSCLRWTTANPTGG